MPGEHAIDPLAVRLQQVPETGPAVGAAGAAARDTGDVGAGAALAAPVAPAGLDTLRFFEILAHPGIVPRS